MIVHFPETQLPIQQDIPRWLPCTSPGSKQVNDYLTQAIKQNSRGKKIC